MRHPAYHLRTNKAVDRFTLISQIRFVLDSESKANFYSLSGPFLEDMKLVHALLPEMPLTSIESNLQTFRRQQFHQFTSRLKLVRSTFEDFIIHSYEPGHQDFFWLDFTDLSPMSLQNFRQVLVRAPHNSLVRITLRAEPDRSIAALQNHLTDVQKEVIENKINEEFEASFGAVLSHDAPRSPLSSSADFARTVQLMVRRVASNALDNGAERDFIHLSSARYDDGSQMLSITGLVVDRAKLKDLAKIFKQRRVAFEVNDWSVPVEIGVPSLSVVERHVLDRHLPRRDQDALGNLLLKKLKYHVDNGETRTKVALRQYARYYREYPSFVKASF